MSALLGFKWLKMCSNYYMFATSLPGLWSLQITSSLQGATRRQFSKPSYSHNKLSDCHDMCLLWAIIVWLEIVLPICGGHIMPYFFLHLDNEWCNFVPSIMILLILHPCPWATGKFATHGPHYVTLLPEIAALGPRACGSTALWLQFVALERHNMARGWQIFP